MDLHFHRHAHAVKGAVPGDSTLILTTSIPLMHIGNFGTTKEM